jgi:hypothetical protein
MLHDQFIRNHRCRSWWASLCDVSAIIFNLQLYLLCSRCFKFMISHLQLLTAVALLLPCCPNPLAETPVAIRHGNADASSCCTSFLHFQRKPCHASYLACKNFAANSPSAHVCLSCTYLQPSVLFTSTCRFIIHSTIWYFSFSNECILNLVDTCSWNIQQLSLHPLNLHRFITILTHFSPFMLL